MHLIHQRSETILRHHAGTESVVFLSITENETTFQFCNNGDMAISIPVGFDNISQRYFHHTPPTPAEIEYAINEIEDELETIVPKLVRYHIVYNSDAFILHLAQRLQIEAASVMTLSRDRLELVFGQYAEISMGRPPSANELDISPTFYAQILIIREIMHHLKFEQLLVIDESDS